MANEYSRRWFGAFLDTMPADWTRDEVAGVMEHLPLPGFRRILDISCGSGRHAMPLAEFGYEVTGIDRDVDALARARRDAPTATFVTLDQRDISSLDGTFDAAMILWQSFGYFDSATNDGVLRDVASRLRTGGRLLLDIYHPGHVRANVGVAATVRAPGCRAITNEVCDGRLRSTIEYVDGQSETMDFELFEPDELTRRAAELGFGLVEACSWWDRNRPPSPAEPRYQLVLELS